MKLKKLIEDYLKEANLMQVATSKDNHPWACSVYFAYDSIPNLYWISLPSTRHSKEIKNNNRVAGTIVLPHTPGDDVRGLQFEGTAKETVDKKEIKQAMQYYAKRYKMPEKRVNAIVENKDGHMCYSIKPTLFVLFDEANFPNNPKQEYRL